MGQRERQHDIRAGARVRAVQDIERVPPGTHGTVRRVYGRLVLEVRFDGFPKLRDAFPHEIEAVAPTGYAAS